MDALRSARRARPSVRRNRVVLIPRRWDHVGDDARASRRPRWLTSPDTGENTYKPLAHRAGNAGCFGVPVVTCLRAFYFCTQGCGCVRAPAFPVPSDLRGTKTMHHSGAKRAAGMWTRAPSSFRSARSASPESIAPRHGCEMDCGSAPFRAK
jgi:hypothetical protein